MTSKSTLNLLMLLAYVLLFAATVPSLLAYEQFNWAMVPLWLTLTVYTASIMKAGTEDKKKADKLAQVVLLVWVTYYAVALIWPWPLKWYDSFAMLALFAPAGSIIGASFLVAYYLFGVAHYVESGDVLQVAGRSILMVVMVITIMQAHNKLKRIDNDTDAK